MKKIAVIVAGGAGQRMGSLLPKQFLLLNNKTVLSHSIEAFLSAFEDIKIIVVLPAEYVSKGEEIIKDMKGNTNISFISGGTTRFHSVQLGLTLVKESAVVFVHDAVRCLLTSDLIRKCYNHAIRLGSAVPAVAATDSIRILQDGESKVIRREDVRIIQTPQTFVSDIILPAFKQPYQEKFTDEATVVEAYGKKIFLIEGEYSNIKITRPLDLIFAEKILSERSPF
jgi:2-C-methyl-D-erythritol 4-phosphate cytidylyltransferase